MYSRKIGGVRGNGCCINHTFSYSNFTNYKMLTNKTSDDIYVLYFTVY